jgi:hypothetical protein
MAKAKSFWLDQKELSAQAIGRPNGLQAAFGPEIGSIWIGNPLIRKLAHTGEGPLRESLGSLRANRKQSWLSPQ